MQRFEIEPGIGVGPVKLGMHRTEVRNIMGQQNFESVRDNSDDFLSGFRVDYDLNNLVKFIEISEAEFDAYEVYFKGICLHKVFAEEAIEHVSKFGSYYKKDPELGFSYVFQNLQLSLWRGTLPESEQADDDLDGRYFETIGLAITGYFDEQYFGQF